MYLWITAEPHEPRASVLTAVETTQGKEKGREKIQFRRLTVEHSEKLQFTIYGESAGKKTTIPMLIITRPTTVNCYVY